MNIRRFAVTAATFGLLIAALYGRVMAFPVDGDQTALPTNTELNEDALRDHLRPSLAKFKIPARIHVVDALPKNPVGKIAKPVLRERVRTQP